MFVPQAGKTAFNQSTLVLIIRVSFAVLCPHFETKITKNKHAAPGKENTNEFTLLCLFVGVVPRFPPSETRHPLIHIKYGRKIMTMCFTRVSFTCVKTFM